MNAASSGPSGPTYAERSAAWRTNFGGTLALSMGVGPLALYALTALSPLVIADLGMTRTQFGSLATFSFLVAAVGSAFAGRVIDRFGGRSTLIGLFATSAVALFSVTFSPSYGWLLLAIGLSGFSQSLSNPVTNQLIAVHLPPGRRGLLMGVKQSGVQMSQFLAGASLPAAAAFIGWREATGGSAVVAVLGIAIVLASVPIDRAAMEPAPQGTSARPGSVPLPRDVYWLTGYTFLMGVALQATNVYMPLYAFESVGLSAALAGATTGVMGAVGLMARIGWGRFAERVDDPQIPLSVLAGCSALGVAALALAGPGLTWLVWVGAAIHGATALASNVVVMLAVVKAVPTYQVGRATGVLAVGLYLGFAAGPVSFGASVDRLGVYLPNWLALIVIYVVAMTVIRIWVNRRSHFPEPSLWKRERDG